MRCQLLFILSSCCLQPVTRSVRVGHGLQCSKCFGSDNKQRFIRAQAAHRFSKIGAIHVGNKAQLQSAVTVITQRFKRHHRPEIGTANPDINDITNGTPAVAFPLTCTNCLSALGHACQYAMHFRHHVNACCFDNCSCRCTQSNMQSGALFGSIDRFTGEHGSALCFQMTFACQLKQ